MPRSLLLFTFMLTATIWLGSTEAAQALFFNGIQTRLLDKFPGEERAILFLTWGSRAMILLYVMLWLGVRINAFTKARSN